MGNPITTSWPKVMLSLAACSLIVIFRAQADGPESVRAELVRLQREYGLTFAWIDACVRRVRAVSFDSRTVVDLEDSLQDFRPDGFNPGDYSGVSGIGTCWSHD